MTEQGKPAPAARSRLVAALVAVAAAAILVAVAVATRGGEEADALRLERSPTGAEVIVYLEDRDANTPDTADGATSVRLECLDRAGEVLINAAQPWPFTDTDGETLDPHVHLALDADRMGRLDRCRLKGTDPVLEGGLL